MEPLNEDIVHLDQWLRVILAAAFGAWAWVVKVAADRHLTSQDRLIKSLNNIEKRLTRVETIIGMHYEIRDSEDDG